MLCLIRIMFRVIMLSSYRSAPISITSIKRIKPEVHKLKDMVNSYEIDDALFFKGLKLLGGKDEHNYRVIFLGLN
ncbi:hypothetical protein GIB67_042424 [Kingdonia uniflora]|uniref:Uncharacterized protein n=1 Tax=Kingdonia uniflora TaxID=39325 RepID=A0A7J7M886_9MAGN|nr:hypothetical protein GIB67_042424 [Kingdonia uniflora]